MKKSNILQCSGFEPDFLVFKRVGKKQSCHVIEMKGGDTFDTKKALIEHQSLHSFVSANAQHLQFTVRCHLVSFNQDDRSAIFTGLKQKVPMTECMTGREFCKLIGIDYDEIVRVRQGDQDDSLHTFVSGLLQIPELKRLINELLV